MRHIARFHFAGEVGGWEGGGRQKGVSPPPPENFEFFSMEIDTRFGEFSYAVGQSSSL